MRRFSKKTVYIALVFLLGVLLIVFSPLPNKLRGFLGRLLSETTVALKEDQVIPEDTFTWELTDLEGNPTKFDAFRGKVLFINFWASWCAPCIAEMPSLQKLYKLYGDDVHFLFVTDDEKAKVDQFLKKGFDLPVYYPKTTVPAIFYSKTIPTTYLIDKKGRIVIARTDADDWFSEEIRALLQTLVEE